jgi:hypothetical protein
MMVQDVKMKHKPTPIDEQKMLNYEVVLDMTLILCNYDLKPIHYGI